MKKDDKVYLQHMLDAIRRIEGYINGYTYEQFLLDLLLQDGVIQQLDVMAEAAGNDSESFRKANQAIPWAQLIGVRNRSIHAYFDVDLAIIWDTVQNDLPPLKAQVGVLLQRN